MEVGTVMKQHRTPNTNFVLSMMKLQSQQSLIQCDSMSHGATLNRRMIVICAQLLLKILVVFHPYGYYDEPQQGF